jgi:phosphoenolpyruvate carboxylase
MSCTRCWSSRPATSSRAPVQWLHESASELRSGDASAGAAMTELVHGLAQDEVEACIRACALQLQLANIAEERERVRRRRHYDATRVRQRESLMDAADQLRATGGWSCARR